VSLSGGNPNGTGSFTATCAGAINVAGSTSAPVSVSYSVGTAVIDAASRPVIECVVTNGDGTYTARFGYSNHNSAAVTILMGTNNKLTPSPIDRGQTTQFEPGRKVNAFQVTWSGGNLV